MSNYKKDFDELIGRVPYYHDNCENITLRYHLPNAMGYREKYNIKYKGDRNDTIRLQCQGFIDLMLTCQNNKNKNYSEMLNALIEINTLIYDITGNIYFNCKFNTKSLENYQKSYEEFVKMLKKYI